MMEACKYCHGTGYVKSYCDEPDRPCPDCLGEGRVTVNDKAKQTINWLVGDVNYDGHQQTHSVLMSVTYPKSKAKENIFQYLEEIENLAIAKSGVDFSKWFSDYQENTISPEDVNKLRAYGVVFNENNWDDPRASDRYIVFTGDDYFDIWKQIIQITDPDVRIEVILVPMYTPKADGYGLFDN